MAGVEIREGFLCPICVQDLGSVIQLQDHFELVHAGEDRAVLNQLKGHHFFECYYCKPHNVYLLAVTSMREREKVYSP